MNSNYTPGQSPSHWPTRGRWSPADLPEWYREMLGEVCRDLTAWREHDPPQRLDPRCDPRYPQGQVQRRAIR